ncbi:excisionase family DNA binding protein [Neolewinella xylanilytica]|uniref:Excisionase family DNA binding protein n=1 Tax=Neolewinella xylanilytica TaxID=1514080 RepID=A0A2S6I753_9BACT|nr:excisionase family DNA binding protein [Neolewinella xylanilytica]
MSRFPLSSTLVVVPADQLSLLIDNAVSAALQKALPASTPANEPEQPHLPALITRHQAASLLSVSLSTVDNYINDGLLEKKRVGVRAVRLDRTQVEKLARKV